MTVRSQLLLALAALAGTACVLRFGAAARAARLDAAVTAESLEVARSRAQELLDLRGSAGSAPLAPRAASALPQRITAVLSARGLGPETLSSFSSTAGARNPTAAAPRQSAKVVLTPIALSRLGGFLAAWREAEPGWVVTSIEVEPAGRRAKGQTAAVAGGKGGTTSGPGLEADLVAVIEMQAAAPASGEARKEAHP